MNQYGAPYMGSKSQIAEDILAILPRGKRFVDLFGGGFAMTHCAMLSGKYEEFYYNELNPLVVDMIKKAISGEYKNERRWIDRETFYNLKDTDGYVKLCWSFGNNGGYYLYAKEIEPWKKALHYARVLGDCSLLKEFGIDSNGSRQDIKANKDEYKEKYIKWYLKNICLSDADFNRLKNDLDKKIKDQKEELRQSLQRLESLESLERLQRLQRLELHCGSYVDYQHKEGDVVYCDPPYENTATYSEDGFNHKEFYDWVASRPYQVYFSSYEISDTRFYKVWSKEKTQLLNGQRAGAKVQETIYCNQPDKVMLF